MAQCKSATRRRFQREPSQSAETRWMRSGLRLSPRSRTVTRQQTRQASGISSAGHLRMERPLTPRNIGNGKTIGLSRWRHDGPGLSESVPSVGTFQEIEILCEREHHAYSLARARPRLWGVAKRNRRAPDLSQPARMSQSGALL